MRAISRELAPLITRADEIHAHHPMMAYYCACRARSRPRGRLIPFPRSTRPS